MSWEAERQFKSKGAGSITMTERNGTQKLPSRDRVQEQLGLWMDGRPHSRDSSAVAKPQAWMSAVVTHLQRTHSSSGLVPRWCSAIAEWAVGVGIQHWLLLYGSSCADIRQLPLLGLGPMRTAGDSSGGDFR